MLHHCLLLALLPTAAASAGGTGGLSGSSQPKFPFTDTSLKIEKRLDDLIGRMSLHQKIGNMFQNGTAHQRRALPFCRRLALSAFPPHTSLLLCCH